MTLSAELAAAPAGSAWRTEVVAGLELTVLETADVDAELNSAIADGRLPPYGRVLWPSALALTAHVAGVDVRGKRVLELGAGCGLVSLACARRGAHVVATDVDARALADLEVAARAHGLLDAQLETARFDVLSDDALPAADILVCADLLYEEHLARALARRVIEAHARGTRSFIGDPGRVSRAVFVARLADAGVSVHFVGEPVAVAVV